jgi:hypothetical protein
VFSRIFKTCLGHVFLSQKWTKWAQNPTNPTLVLYIK